MGEVRNAAWRDVDRNPSGRGPFRLAPRCCSLLYPGYTALLAPCARRNGPPSPPWDKS